MSYSNSFPQQRPTLNLDFANSGKLDSRISYSRSSTGTYLSNEKSLNSENLLLQSQDFDTTWTASGIAAPTGSQTAPDGTSTAWLITADTFTGGSARVQQSMSIDTNTEYTMVAHVKAGTATHAFISFRASSSHSCSVTLNFATQALTNTAFVFTNVTSSVTALGNDWFKLTLTGTTGAFNSGPVARVGISDGSAVAANGNPSWNASGETMYAWGVQLSSTNSKVYDSPTTTQISRKYSPLLKTASANAPRFEFDESGNAEGLLIEAQATNLQRYGSAFASWSNFPNVTVTSNAAVAPNGLLDADLAVAGSTPTSTYVYDNSTSIVSGTTYTASLYIKSAGQRYVQLLGGSSSFHADRYATFDLQTGSVDANAVTASAQDVGNGWWRIQMSILATATSSAGIAIAFVSSATSSYLPTFTGNDFDGLLIWGFQLETGSSTSSLVDTGTSSSSATRAADSCSVANFGYTGGPLTVVSETETQVDENNRIIIAIDKDTSNRFYVHGKSANSRAAMLTSGGINHFLNYSTDANGKHAVRFDTNNYSVCVNGGTVTDFVGNVSLPDVAGATMLIGDDANSGNSIEGHIKRLALYSAALSDTELQAITS